MEVPNLLRRYRTTEDGYSLLPTQDGSDGIIHRRDYVKTIQDNVKIVESSHQTQTCEDETSEQAR